MNDEIQMKTQKGGDLLRETEETRQKGKKKKGLLKTKDFIQILLNLIQVVFMLSSECKHEVKTSALLTLESKELAWS